MVGRWGFRRMEWGREVKLFFLTVMGVLTEGVLAFP